jgi:hypothetical protein
MAGPPTNVASVPQANLVAHLVLQMEIGFWEMFPHGQD